ncbi:G-protein coupled receptor 52 [Holothuria leucospilota]|uniref:G-protein coupled receptor 52 n=1 Tax=Holothuria leucospilota TaxID=206669 RepID=A0A9Q1HFA0_HOLLE|nr:G-protein coupled receptor 52 [Holothuria leucospilota]
MDPNLTTGLTQVSDLEPTTDLYSTVATTRAYTYVIPVSAVAFLSVFSALIIVANVLVLLVYTFTNTLRIPVSAYMKSLAVADLWVGVNCATNIALTLNNGQWPFGLPLCKLVAYLLVVSVGVSVTSLTVISVDRYIAICHPMRYRNLISKPRARFIAILVWIVSALFYLPSNFDWFRSNPALKAIDCTLHFRYNISFSFFLLAITIIPNFILSFISYSFILATLIKRKGWLRKTTERGMNPQGDSVKARRKEQDKLMAKIGMAILSAFYITWLPYLVFGTMRQLRIFNPPQSVINLSLYLGISNSFLNCFIYSIANKAFRTGVKHLLKKICCIYCQWKKRMVLSSTESSNFVDIHSSEKNGENENGIDNAMHKLS